MAPIFLGLNVLTKIFVMSDIKNSAGTTYQEQSYIKRLLFSVN